MAFDANQDAVILGGIFLCYLLPLIYIGTPHAVSCAFRRYGIGVCLSLCLGALLVKLSRIHRIFNRNQPTTILIAPFIDWKSQLVFTAIIVVLRLLIYRCGSYRTRHKYIIQVRQIPRYSVADFSELPAKRPSSVRASVYYPQSD